jgi:hypothetical protein
LAIVPKRQPLARWQMCRAPDPWFRHLAAMTPPHPSLRLYRLGALGRFHEYFRIGAKRVS